MSVKCYYKDMEGQCNYYLVIHDNEWNIYTYQEYIDKWPYSYSSFNAITRECRSDHISPVFSFITMCELKRHAAEKLEEILSINPEYRSGKMQKLPDNILELQAKFDIKIDDAIIKKYKQEKYIEFKKEIGNARAGVRVAINEARYWKERGKLFSKKIEKLYQENENSEMKLTFREWLKVYKKYSYEFELLSYNELTSNCKTVEEYWNFKDKEISIQEFSDIIIKSKKTGFNEKCHNRFLGILGGVELRKRVVEKVKEIEKKCLTDMSVKCYIDYGNNRRGRKSHD